ncbi:phage major capsid protein [Oenococcus sp.]|uniref:phage major capsid protein n=1 Tax=Oenococcus sp. TaxID=1979414 RepID=UPI0039EC329C
MNIKEQIKQEKSELKAKIQEARSAIADGQDNVDELEKDVESRQAKIQKLEKLASAEIDAEDRDEPEDPDEEVRALKAKQEEEQRKINGAQGHKVNAFEKKNADEKKTEMRSVLNAFIHSHGKTVKPEARDTGQLVSTDLGMLIPEEISYQPQDTPMTVVDLSQYVHTFPTTAASGKYPVRGQITDRFYTAEELAANPKLKANTYTPVPWSVDTYRGELDISEEAIDDSAIDLTGEVNSQLHELSLNTKNFLIASQLKSFTAKPIVTLDDLKAIINVSLDPAYNKTLVASQSFYNFLDTLKDGNGRYLLQDSITSPSGKVVLGLPVLPVSDTLIGDAGGQNAFIGDLYRGVLMPLRKETYVNWVTNENYEQKMLGALRTCASTADAGAGFFVTHTAA